MSKYLMVNDDTRSHGASDINFLGIREYVRGFSLIDITNSGVLAPYKSASAFMDNANQVVRDEASWNRSRNQQRNWEILMQVIGMVTQPSVLQKPVSFKNQNLSTYKFGYDGEGTVWTFSLGAEQSSVFDTHEPAGRLKEICHGVPVSVGIKESITMDKQVFDTQDIVNLYFEKIEF